MPMVPAPGLAKLFTEALRHHLQGSNYAYFRLVAKNSIGSVIGTDVFEWNYFAGSGVETPQPGATPWQFGTANSGRWFNSNGSLPAQSADIQDHLSQTTATYQGTVRLNTAVGYAYTVDSNPEKQITLENASGGSYTFHYLEMQFGTSNSNSSEPGTWHPLFVFTVPGNPLVLGIGEKIRLARMYLKFYAGTPTGSFVRTVINPTYMGTITSANASTFEGSGAWVGLFSASDDELSLNYNVGHTALAYQRQHVRFIRSAGKLFMINPAVFNEVRGSSVSIHYIKLLTAKTGGSSLVTTTTGSGLITLNGSPVSVNVNNQPWIDVSNAPYLLIV